MAYTTIDNPELYFQAKAWTGTGSEIAITFDGSENMQPDWVWLKKRSASGIHVSHDSVRGATKRLIPNSSDAETTQAQYVKSFDSNGITFGTDTDINASSATAILWGWKAGNSSGSSNSNGSITSTVSASTDAGFSVVSWTGSGSAATIGHGLSATPKYIIVKNRTDSVNWFLYNHSIITAGASNKSFMTLNETDALGTNGSATTFTSVSSTTFGVGTDNIINGSSDNMIAYVFAEKKGYSKFGKYEGNGNSDGPCIHLGFKPAWLMIKQTSGAGNDWLLYDNKRDTFNVASTILVANGNGAEATGQSFNFIDLLSNGFKLKGSDARNNGSGATYIYMAFAESPQVNSSGVPNNAR